MNRASQFYPNYYSTQECTVRISTSGSTVVLSMQGWLYYVYNIACTVFSLSSNLGVCKKHYTYRLTVMVHNECENCVSIQVPQM